MLKTHGLADSNRPSQSPRRDRLFMAKKKPTCTIDHLVFKKEIKIFYKFFISVQLLYNLITY